MVALAAGPSEDERTHRPYSEHERTARTYLDHHLPPSGRDAALAEALDEARHWGDTDLEDVLRCARRSLLARAEPPPESEAAVLVVRCGLDAHTTAEVTGLDEVAVRHAANALVEQDRPRARSGAEPASPVAPRTDVDRLGRRARLPRIGIVVLLAVAVSAAIGLILLRSDLDEPAAPAAADFEITGLAVTDDPAAEGTEGPFAPGQRILIAIHYVPDARDTTVDLSVLHPDGAVLLGTGVRLPRVRERIQVPIPGRLLDDAGEYRATVRRDGERLADVTFTVAD